MAKRSVRIRVHDILEAIDGAKEILDGRDFADYQKSFPARKGVERCVEIISEASRHIPSDLTDKYPAIQWHSIKAIGNFLRHEYGKVDDLVIWRIAAQALPELRPVIVEIIASLGDP
jgi:uncharacterized protein with HEPN domain